LPDAEKFTTAFALAGLGGFNAHGAGFLTAASDDASNPLNDATH
jgi:hypothetical protein